MSASRLTSQVKSAAGAFVLALLTWVGVNFVTSFERVVEDVKLDLRLPQGWVVNDLDTDRFTIWLRGSREDVSRLSIDSLKLEVDLRDRKMSDELIEKLSVRNVRVPGAVRAVAIKPELVKIRLDSSTAKRVPVRPQLSGHLPEGYEMDSATCEPDVVILSGSRQRLEEISFLQTVPVDLGGRIQSFEASVDVAPASPGSEESIEPRRVKVQVKISSRYLRKNLENVPVRILLPPMSMPRPFRVEPETIRVTVEAGEAMFRGFSADKVLAFVAPTGSITGSIREPIQVRVPSGINAVEFTPKSVLITPAPSP
jgi:hypothetical protein